VATTFFAAASAMHTTISHRHHCGAIGFQGFPFASRETASNDIICLHWPPMILYAVAGLR
jgi:hypothetical protein